MIEKFIRLVLKEIDNSSSLNHQIFLKYSGEEYSLTTNVIELFLDLNKLNPFVNTSTKKTALPKVAIYAYKYSLPLEFISNVKENGITIKVDGSLYADLSSDGKRFDDGSEWYCILIEKTKTVIFFNKNSSEVYLFNDNRNPLSLDTIRIIKSLISIQSEMENSVMLHASGVVLNNQDGVLLLGDSRNGKTTILLELMTKFYVNMMSCDTSILTMKENRLMARGWPSNFSMSTGTMYDYECLNTLIPDDRNFLTYKQAWSIFDKYVANTSDVIKNSGAEIIPEIPVKLIICLKFNPSGPIQIEEITNDTLIKAWFQKVYLGSRDALYPNWHEFWKMKDDDIDQNIERYVNFIVSNNIKVYEMSWAPGPEQLLRRIDLLDSFNRSAVKTHKYSKDFVS